MNNNEHEALNLIRRGIVESRSDLARVMKISRPTASVIVESLLKSSKIEERGNGQSARGKSPVLLGVMPGEKSFIGLDLGYASKLAGVVLDGSGAILQRREVGNTVEDMEDIVAGIIDIVHRLGNGRHIAGLGLAVPGIIDESSGVVLRSVNPLFLGDTLKRCVSRHFDFPVCLCNRSRAAIYSEAYGGAGSKDGSFTLISLGRSIGASFWLNGALFDGSHGGCGEIRGILLKSGETLEEALSPDRCKNLDESQVLDYCSEGLGHLLDIMDLELMVLAGRFANYSADFARLLEDRFNYSRQCSVRMSSFGQFSAARGVAFRMIEDMEI